MEKTVIEQESSLIGRSATEKKIGFNISGPSPSKSMDAIPRPGSATSAWNSAVSIAYDPSGAKPPRDRHPHMNGTTSSSNTAVGNASDPLGAKPPKVDWTSRNEARRKPKATRRKQLKSVQNEKTTGKQKEIKKPEEAQRAMEPSDVGEGIERMRITLPPLDQVVPSSSLTLARLRICTTSLPSIIPAKEPDSTTSSENKPTAKVTTKASIGLVDSIAEAILSNPIHCMTALHVCDWITENCPHHRTETCLTNAVRNYLRRKPETFKIVGNFGRHNIWTVLPQMKASFT